MNMPIDERDGPLHALLARAYPGPDCPPPEAYLPGAELSDAERARIEAHARACPACAAERELARGFAEPVRTEADNEAIVQKLQASAPWHARAASSSNVTPIGGRRARRRRSFMGLPLAMAAGILIATGAALQLLGPHAPPIGAPGSGNALRGAAIEVVAPAGDVREVPRELDWRAVPDATSYRVSIVGVDGEPLWNETVTGSPAMLPATAANALHGAVLYRWQVEALDANGARIAWSKPTEFRIAARTGEPPGD